MLEVGRKRHQGIAQVLRRGITAISPQRLATVGPVLIIFINTLVSQAVPSARRPSVT